MNTPEQPEAPVETPSHTPTRADVHTPVTPAPDALTTLHDTLRTPALPHDALAALYDTPRRGDRRIAQLERLVRVEQERDAALAELDTLRADLARAERERAAANETATQTLRARDLDRAELRSVRTQRDEMSAALTTLCADLARTEQERERAARDLADARADLAHARAARDTARTERDAERARADRYAAELLRIRGGL